MRVCAIIEYDGSAFSGWQRQTNARSVQQCVEEAISKVADHPVAVTVAGRTDAGVHACAQVVHFDTEAERSTYAWVRGTNSNLPDDVALLWAGDVDSGFHARFSAVEREYRYVILNRPVRPTYLARHVTHEHRPLEVERMRSATRFLIGKHDFSAFRAAECQAKSPVRELRALDISRQGEFVTITARANAFLHHMVRNLSGVLMDIGCGERVPEWAGEVLAARDRKLGSITAPPDGLYLTAVEYPEGFHVPRMNPLVPTLTKV